MNDAISERLNHFFEHVYGGDIHRFAESIECKQLWRIRKFFGPEAELPDISFLITLKYYHPKLDYEWMLTGVPTLKDAGYQELYNRPKYHEYVSERLDKIENMLLELKSLFDQ